MSKSSGLNSAYPPNVSLVLRGKELDPQKVTDSLGIIPHRSYRRGDKRNDGKLWPHGFWSIISSGQVHDANLMRHIKWVVEQIKPAQSGLHEILSDERIDGKISCFWTMESSHETLAFDTELLSQLAGLNIRMELDIYGPD